MIYLDHFIPIFVNSGERAQTELGHVEDTHKSLDNK